MFETFLRKVKLVFEDGALRSRILFVLGALVVFRLLAAIPIPGINAASLESYLNSNQFLGLLNIFSGGGFSNLSIVMLGVGPYITASIVMQLMTVLIPKLKEMYQEEGDAGRMRFAQYSRYLTVPLAFVQAFGFLLLLQQNGVVPGLTLFGLMTNVTVIAAGSILLMWIGELISEFGVGNGISLMIFAGIVASVPQQIAQGVFSFDISQLPAYLGFIAAGVVIMAGVVFITEAERPIPVTYARRVRGNKVLGGISTYLPLRVNQAGVMPIIFALSFLLFPQMIATFLSGISISWLAAGASAVVAALANQWVYGGLYFVLVVVFTYFYTAITFEPHQIAKNLQKNGAFVPGVRPGGTTADYLGNIITRITLVGALFLGLLAVLPIILQGITGITAITIGGTALLIVVSVVLDLVKKIDAQTSIREY
ncbi:preprotein translocase subunit SecY [Candidatus Kaiserbacteria bacterium RIFCSPHIGHO2_02_FULL_55_25]|uniref:Protein translocase subunit SecY n=1 Tax=Candidatus Kaiserbacteria bacterium RIFCSPHIGHO2_02_FULL_55_25 TaxID=1798498 RepID=A0A1F6EAC6_9BACT|nr:MAG: preprotein translocase subunit SecY [Candidatus Kaiserbacteria bacterium RIFCSPHIGHO2_01_FULL_55_79]OGG70618.1 MAG: preprotein translocase subunit SecY [Candidatus Kaiserbacteria bacterium RIFCSPHIGHO2_02_FULL_55_25]OGG78732.1 MAG: preprotein translocase subunit SecY [Candidatus Kaiserbacteria bacterium RIFCSPHIGHO2_12_FULL_55_13]OGG82695.1 MAG: preprotein translocase subunit SecY [Candidatus Kaiserbacteria bacterium RIFCSPLOWO2_01_FULL_55_25]